MNRQPYAESCLYDFVTQKYGLKLKVERTLVDCVQSLLDLFKLGLDSIIFLQKFLKRQYKSKMLQMKGLECCLSVIELNLLLPPAGY